MSGLTQYDSSAFIFRAHTLIIEVTYLDGEMGKAEKYGHIHIEDIVQNAHLFAEVEHLVFVHLSQKYSLRYVCLDELTVCLSWNFPSSEA